MSNKEKIATLLMTPAEAAKFSGFTYAEMHYHNAKFREYCKLADCACGLLPYWRLPKAVKFQTACALHDYWDASWQSAVMANVTIEMVDQWFRREMNTIVAGASYWERLYLAPLARLFMFLVIKFRPLRWKK